MANHLRAFMAHWVPSSLAVSPSENDELRSNVTDLSVFYRESKYGRPKYDVPVGPAIRLEASWLPYLDPTEYTTTTGADGVSDTATQTL